MRGRKLLKDTFKTNFAQKRELVKRRNEGVHPFKLNAIIFTKSFLSWTLLGIIGGVVTGLYWFLISSLMDLTQNFLEGWQVITIMTLGGLVVGLIIYFWGDPGELDIVVNNVRFKGGRLDTKHNVPMIITSALGIGVGSNAGPEAPMVQVNGSIGSWLGKKLKLQGQQLRSMTIAGMAVGFSNMFGSVLGGSLFAVEIMHHKRVTQYYRELIPVFVAAGTGYMVFQLITKMGIGPVWELPFEFYMDDGIIDIIWGIGYGVIGALVGWVIVFFFRLLEKGFKNARLPFYFQTTLSGLILGVLAWKFPVTRYFSHYEVITLLNGSWTLWVLVILMFVKIFSMTLCVTSGWKGGFIVPIFFIGAALGMIVFQVFPGQNLGLAVVCSMVAVNACVTRTILSSVFLVATLTGYQLLVPILFAGLTGFFLAPRSPMIEAEVGQ